MAPQWHNLTPPVVLSPAPTIPYKPRPRLRPTPKAYTEQQLNFLKSYLPDFERRSVGPIRGDAKKFALDRASEFITRFGLPDEYETGEEAEGRFKEQLYNWFKNTIGRHRRKADGRSRSARRVGEKVAGPPRHRDDSWDHPGSSGSSTLSGTYTHAESSPPTISGPNYPENTPTTGPPSPTMAPRIPMQYSMPSTLANALQPSPSPPPPPPPPAPVTVASLRDAFLQNMDAPQLASQIQAFVISRPSSLALKPVILALFQAIASEYERNKSPPNPFLTRFLGAAAYFTPAIIHAGVSGPLAGTRALQMQIRKSAKWIATPATYAPPNLTSPSNASSMSHELHRITLDRTRRKEHIQWARIHAAAIEVGVFDLGYEIPESDRENSAGYTYGEGRVFSNVVAHDALWEDDEVEWVAGILVLQALIRTSMRGDTAQVRLYEGLLMSYEERWKEMKDEARQALVTEVLLAAKHDLARMASGV
ncbi:hypothetical protein B0H15DRAFT_177820 [Mycena belliarum]|uniref:Uncharacterized protein n=1 Tax=Mycena belliarum TaxID=1033014 RepID=A0AAD6XSA0_9AGAR|nr:hypothetical protein B0H15DRAFT_177820 [Mycena belliae]